MELDITQFMTTGQFGFIALGMSKSELEEQGFPPDDWLANKTKKTSTIWRYGNFELHFNDGSMVSEIYNDYVPRLDGGSGICICNWWLLQNGAHTPTLQEVLQEYTTLRMDFIKEHIPSGCVVIRLKHGVYMLFDEPSGQLPVNPNEWKTCAIGKK